MIRQHYRRISLLCLAFGLFAISGKHTPKNVIENVSADRSVGARDRKRSDMQYQKAEIGGDPFRTAGTAHRSRSKACASM
jgi:hypothetical protein